MSHNICDKSFLIECELVAYALYMLSNCVRYTNKIKNENIKK